MSYPGGHVQSHYQSTSAFWGLTYSQDEGGLNQFPIVSTSCISRESSDFVFLTAVRNRLWNNVGLFLLGWATHYFPFFLMNRQLFLHHYFPALYFAILFAASGFDLVTSALRPKIRLQIAAVLIIIAIWNFIYLSPLAYGTPWTQEKCKNAQWFKSWDFSW